MKAPKGVALLGPAIVAAVAYLDPGNVATNLSAGAGFGYLLTWVIVLANLMAWLVQYLSAKLGIVTGAVFLMPAVTAFTGSFFVDELAEEVGRTRYSAHPPGKALPLPLAMYEGIKTALLAVLVYLCALPFLFFAGFGLVIMFLATAYLLSREYFLLAAMRFHSVEEAKAMRSARSGTIFVAGLPIALFVSIPIVNLATPLFATALMVHTFKRIEGRRVELIEPKRA